MTVPSIGLRLQSIGDGPEPAFVLASERERTDPFAMDPTA
jgi:hypothetical protein